MGGCGNRTWEQKAEESGLVEAVTRERLLETLQAGEYLACSDLWSVEIGDSGIAVCSYNL
jgi:hypothetical protein